MKTQLRILLILMAFSTQYVLAEDFTQQDIAFVFDDAATENIDSEEMQLLSNQEMIATEGRWTMYSPFGLFLWAIDGIFKDGLPNVNFPPPSPWD